MLQVGTMRVTFTVLQASNQKAPKEHFGTPELKTLGFFAFQGVFNVVCVLVKIRKINPTLTADPSRQTTQRQFGIPTKKWKYIMSSTFTLPLRLNTRQTTSNDGTISTANTGAAMISQQVTIVAGAAATITIPAGSIINSIDGYLNVVGAASRAISITSNDTTTSVATLATTALGRVSATYTASAAVANLLANVGLYDITLTLASEAASAGTLSVQYTGRNQDGSIIAYGSGYTNN